MGAEQQVVYGVTEAGVKPTAASADASAPLQLTSERLRVWGARAVFSLLDQGLFSGAGFLVNLLLARWLAPASYGAFAVAFAAFLFIAGFYNVLLLEPLTVMGAGRHSDNLRTYFRVQLRIHFILVGGLALAGLLGGLVTWLVRPDSPLVGAIFGTALMLPLLLLLWLVRRMCYVMHRPRLAVAGTASYFVLIIAGLMALRYFNWATPLLAFLLVGAASLVSSGVLLARFGFFRGPQKICTMSWRDALSENWTYGRWLVGSTTLYSISNQTQMYLVAVMLGLGAAGVLRAMQLPSLLMTQAVTAAGLLFLPALSRDFGRGDVNQVRRKAMIVSTTLAFVGLMFVALLVVVGSPLERVMYSGKFAAQAWLIPVLGLIPVATGFSTGFSMALKAAGKPHYDLVANTFAAPVCVVSALAFVYWWGLPGAAISMILSFAVYGLTYFYYFQRWSKINLN
jgi:O-antigen/teichoic acid export membrane protein